MEKEVIHSLFTLITKVAPISKGEVPSMEGITSKFPQTASQMKKYVFGCTHVFHTRVQGKDLVGLSLKVIYNDFPEKMQYSPSIYLPTH